MTNIAREPEVWKQYPEFDFVEVSNLGRVRTKDRTMVDKNGRKYFVRGRVLKQRLLPNGYVQVQISVNGKHFYLSVHRMVAVTYIPNPNNLPKVDEMQLVVIGFVTQTRTL